MKLKPTSSNSPSQTITATTSKEVRVLVHETLRISANLASAPPPAAELRLDEANLGLVEGEFVNSSLRLICFEEIDGRRWKYLAENNNGGGSIQFKKGSIRAICLQSPQAPAEVTLCFNTQKYI